MNGAVNKLFFSSGRICQSSKIKAGSHYRIYSALCTNIGNVVLYSDNFGRTWLPLGGADARPTLDGDEAKVVELPNGSVLLSSRSQKGNGRIFNIYTYTNAKKLRANGISRYISTIKPIRRQDVMVKCCLLRPVACLTASVHTCCSTRYR